MIILNILSNVSQFNLGLLLIPSLILLFFILLFILINNKNVIKASDGSIFPNQEDCDRYEALLKKINSILLSIQSDQEILQKEGFDLEFVERIKVKGFSDAKTIIKYKDQFDLLLKVIS
tara:strand:+ start:1444 stop:1800 length:357 start_codon:yes stop_codon:yes gene_type:complete